MRNSILNTLRQSPRRERERGGEESIVGEGKRRLMEVSISISLARSSLFFVYICIICSYYIMLSIYLTLCLFVVYTIPFVFYISSIYYLVLILKLETL